MPDYYIRTPEQDESRGPFDFAKLLTLAEAGQISPNTLYYDEEKEEWVPIALNETLKAQVFPEREKLSLKMNPEQEQAAAKPEEAENDDLNVEAMLSAAEGNTAEKRKQTREKKSFNMAANMSAFGLGLMMILSAVFLILPFTEVIQVSINEGKFAELLNYPFLILAIIDLVMGILLMLAVTELYPAMRFRGMLTLGFGIYVGWAIGDPLVMGLTAAAGFGVFLASLSQSVSSMVLAFVLGIGGHAYLCYLAMGGRFDGFFESILFNLVPS